MNEEIEFDKEDLILKTTQFPTWRERIYNRDALYLWTLALEQEDKALRKLALHRPSQSRN